MIPKSRNETLFKTFPHSLFFVRFGIKRDLEIYFNIPYQFFANSRLRIAVEANKRLYIPVTYEILMSNHNPKCSKYSNSYSGSFDKCKEADVEKKIKAEFNCSVPYEVSQSASRNVCQGSVTKKVSRKYDEYFKKDSEQCPQSCWNMLSTFGWPKYSNGSGRAQFYFNNIVKVTEDFVSYDLLR